MIDYLFSEFLDILHKVDTDKFSDEELDRLAQITGLFMCIAKEALKDTKPVLF